MRIVCLPLDSRPCCFRFPQELAAWSGDTCVLPRPTEMDDFVRPANHKDTVSFLERELPGANAAVISVDHLCYGSLLASREEAVPLETALSRLDWLAALRRRFPEIPFHLDNVILRATISALSSDQLEVYEAMKVYSYQSDIGYETGSLDALRQAQEAAARIPGELRRKYHAVRRRNHAINRRCVELVQQGIFDTLSLLMEDAQPYGFHRAEQRELRSLIGGDPRIFLRNGADEGGALSVMKAALDGQEIPAEILYIGRGEDDFIAQYEDRPFRENLVSALQYAHVIPTPGVRKVLAISCPPDGVQARIGETTCPEAIPGMAQTLDRLIDEGREVYLLDLLSRNGGSLPLVETMAHADRLAGYSGWNTASNAMGTVIAQLLSDVKADAPDTDFRNERFLDDLYYESLVRQQLNEYLRARGEDPYRLTDKDAAEAELRRLFDKLERPLLDHIGAFRVSLPWSRTFEVCAEVS